MYGYQSDEPTEIKAFLRNHSQEEIFRIALGEYPVIGQRIRSPLRTDSSAGCWFEWNNDKLFFVDFADIPINRDCLQFIKDYYSLNTISDAIDYVISYSEENHLTRLANPNLLQGVSNGKEYSLIQVHAKPFRLQDKLFWSPYGITSDNLIEDNIFSVAMYKVYSQNRKRWTSRNPIDICYAIGGFEGRYKIYNPHEKGKRKWTTNCTQNDVGGMSSLAVYSDILIITKSYKDWRVIKNEGFEVIWFQNEGMLPSDEILLNLAERFIHIYVLFDNDEAGIKASIKVQEKFALLGKQIDSFTSPYKHLKDPADIRLVKESEIFKRFLCENCQK